MTGSLESDVTTHSKNNCNVINLIKYSLSINITQQGSYANFKVRLACIIRVKKTTTSLEVLLGLIPLYLQLTEKHTSKF